MWRKAATGGARRDALDATTRWVGGLSCVAGTAAWAFWFAWRATSSPVTAVGALVAILELIAFASAVVIGLALWTRRPTSRQVHSASSVPSLLPDVFAELFGLDEHRSVPVHGSDDSGEVARARRGLRLLDLRRRREGASGNTLATGAWALVAVEGIRRMAFVALLLVVLLGGRAPFEMPPTSTLLALVGAQGFFAVGHWMLSGGVLRPGVRLRWSMASIGAGLGDGVSRSGLPIRWTATMGTMIALNLAVALRGLSDRWTHGLSPMLRDERVAAMVLAWWLVLVGFAALRTLTQPSLGFYGATHRLEENSTRRLAMGTTLAVSMVGFVAGVLPGALPA